MEVIVILEKIPEDFYLRDTHHVARNLIGKYLIRDVNGTLIAGRITETESYIGAIDKACHAYGYKKTQRTKMLFEKGGIAYVYLIYGIYCCMNVIAEKEGEPCGVLIRAADIVLGQDKASELRYGKKYEDLKPRERTNLSNGPGKLCIAMGISRELNGARLSGDDIYISPDIEGITSPEFKIEEGKRIGIDYAQEARDFLWRYTIKYSDI